MTVRSYSEAIQYVYADQPFRCWRAAMTTGPLLIHRCDERRPCANVDLRPTPVKSESTYRQRLRNGARSWTPHAATLEKGERETQISQRSTGPSWGFRFRYFCQRQNWMETYAVL